MNAANPGELSEVILLNIPTLGYFSWSLSELCNLLWTDVCFDADCGSVTGMPELCGVLVLDPSIGTRVEWT